jgi:hypothetical protein
LTRRRFFNLLQSFVNLFEEKGFTLAEKNLICAVFGESLVCGEIVGRI